MDNRFVDLHTNQRLLLTELLNRGVEIVRVDTQNEIVVTSYLGHQEILFDRYGSVMPHNYVVLFADKILTKQHLNRQGFSCPIGNAFLLAEKEEIVAYAKKTLHPPFVLKPNRWSHGEGIIMYIDSYAELEEHLEQLATTCSPETMYIIEEHFMGSEYRIFITRNGNYAVLEREPASVTGDGIHTIHELANAESWHRDPTQTSLCPVAVSASFLAKQGRTSTDIPLQGELVAVQAVSNVALGGMSKNRTQEIHPSYIDLASKLSACFHGLPYLWIDMLIPALQQPATPLSYAIIECNTQPWLKMHMLPGEGHTENVASFVADLLYPETKKTP